MSTAPGHSLFMTGPLCPSCPTYNREGMQVRVGGWLQPVFHTHVCPGESVCVCVCGGGGGVGGGYAGVCGCVCVYLCVCVFACLCVCVCLCPRGYLIHDGGGGGGEEFENIPTHRSRTSRRPRIWENPRGFDILYTSQSTIIFFIQNEVSDSGQTFLTDSLVHLFRVMSLVVENSYWKRVV